MFSFYEHYTIIPKNLLNMILQAFFNLKMFSLFIVKNIQYFILKKILWITIFLKFLLRKKLRKIILNKFFNTRPRTTFTALNFIHNFRISRYKLESFFMTEASSLV